MLPSCRSPPRSPLLRRSGRGGVGVSVSRYHTVCMYVCVSVCPSSAQTPVGTAEDSGLAFFSPGSLGSSA